MKRTLLMALGVVALVGLTTTRSFAQDSKGDVAGGWQYLHQGLEIDIIEVGRTPKGFFVEGAVNVTPMFAVIGGYTASFKNVTSTVGFPPPVGSVSSTFDMAVRTFMGGVRVGAPAGRVVKPFAQVLLGGVDSSVEFSFQFPELSLEALAGTRFGFDFAGGADVMVSRRVGLRAKASLLRVNSYTDDNGFRFQTGVVIPF